LRIPLRVEDFESGFDEEMSFNVILPFSPVPCWGNVSDPAAFAATVIAGLFSNNDDTSLSIIRPSGPEPSIADSKLTISSFFSARSSARGEIEEFGIVEEELGTDDWELTAGDGELEIGD
jgi:hypothetical protein